MNKLNDYSGEFIPDLKFSDFTPDMLSELLKLYSKLYIAVDGFWYLAVKERINNEEALACDIKVWERGSKYELAKITKLLNINGNDVIALSKAMQVSPWFQHIKYKIEFDDKNNATLTVTDCPTLNALEKEGTGREEQICQIVEPKVFNEFALFFNPDIKVNCLKIPPRKSKDEICCQWKFSL